MNCDVELSDPFDRHGSPEPCGFMPLWARAKGLSLIQNWMFVVNIRIKGSLLIQNWKADQNKVAYMLPYIRIAAREFFSSFF